MRVTRVMRVMRTVHEGALGDQMRCAFFCNPLPCRPDRPLGYVGRRSPPGAGSTAGRRRAEAPPFVPSLPRPRVPASRVPASLMRRLPVTALPVTALPVAALPVAALQLVGWSAYAVGYYAILRDATGFPGLLMQQTAATAALGLAVSTALAGAFRLAQRAGAPPPLQTLAVVAGILGGGLAWAALAAGATEAIDPFEAPAPLFGPSGTATPRPSRLAHVAALAVWSGLYLALRTWQQQRAQARRLLEADAAASTARLQMLRYQLNPHFFFNALNTISALADEDPARVKTVVSRLSGFLRYTLLDADTLVVPLGEEVEAARRYLDVEQIRFEDDLQVQVDVPPAAAARRVPAFVLLPLVENAVKHGLRTSPFPLRVRLSARLDEASGADEAATLVLTVANTGTLRADDAEADAAPGTETGLANVRARLAAHYARRHAFTLAETSDGWVRARLALTGAPDVG